MRDRRCSLNGIRRRARGFLAADPAYPELPSSRCQQSGQNTSKLTQTFSHGTPVVVRVLAGARHTVAFRADVGWWWFLDGGRARPRKPRIGWSSIPLVAALVHVSRVAPLAGSAELVERHGRWIDTQAEPSIPIDDDAVWSDLPHDADIAID